MVKKKTKISPLIIMHILLCAKIFKITNIKLHDNVQLNVSISQSSGSHPTRALEWADFKCSLVRAERKSAASKENS